MMQLRLDMTRGPEEKDRKWKEQLEDGGRRLRVPPHPVWRKGIRKRITTSRLSIIITPTHGG